MFVSALPVLLLTTLNLFAQAGGGGSFGGGGGGGGGGDSGDILQLIVLTFRYPKIGIPM